MDISNSIKFFIKQFDDKQYVYEKFVITEGINGVIPGMSVTILTYNDDVPDEIVDVKLVVNDVVKIDTKGFIYERVIDGNKSLTLSISLMSKDLIFGPKSFTYESQDEIISSLWSGRKEGIPSGSNIVANQCLEYSSDYLTKTLLSIKKDFAFSYEASGTLRGIDMTDTQASVTTDMFDEYSILDQRFDAKYNPLEDIPLTETELMATQVVTSNTFRFCEKDAINIYSNYTYNKALYNRFNQKLSIKYFNYGVLRIGDVIELTITPQLKEKYRVFFTQVKFINKEFLVISQLALINE